MSVSGGMPGLDRAVVVSDATCAVGTILTIDTTNTTATKLVMAAATAATTVALAVAQEASTAANTVLSARFAGIALVKVNGSSTAISEGDAIVATTAGVGVKIGTAGATANYPIGYALQPSSGNGDLIYVLIAPHERGKHTS